MAITIIGIDCATDPKKVGLAKAVLSRGRVLVQHAEPGTAKNNITQRVTEWLESDRPALIALDAPLGWPEALGSALAHHNAGEVIKDEPNNLFRRETDRFIKNRTAKQPLDVGADRIARTAVFALTLLSYLRELTGKPIPLAWNPELIDHRAIEVYPAGTLTAYKLPNGKYKENSETHRAVREQIVRGLPEWVEIADEKALFANADVLDAVLCCVAGADFLSYRSMEPTDPRLARKEGWIWVRALGTACR